MGSRSTSAGSSTTDAELVIRARDGDQAALAEIYDRYARRLVDLARGIVGPSGAEDVVHDAFVGAAQRLDQLRDPDALRAWLYRITHRTAITHLRRRKAEPSGLDYDVIDPNVPDENDGAADPALTELVASAESGLEERDRELLRLLYRHDLTPDEAAAVLDLRPGQVHDRSFRARERFARSLDAVTVAREGRHDCGELDGMLRDWDGSVTPKWRKRVSRHLDRCRSCDATRKRVSSPAALLSVAPLALAVPAMRETTLTAMSMAMGTGVGPSGSHGSESAGPAAGAPGSPPPAAAGPATSIGGVPPATPAGATGAHPGIASTSASVSASSAGSVPAAATAGSSASAAGAAAAAKSAAAATTPLVAPVDVSDPGGVSSLIGAVTGSVTVAVGIAAGAPPPPTPPTPPAVVVEAKSALAALGAPVIVTGPSGVPATDQAVGKSAKPAATSKDGPATNAGGGAASAADPKVDGVVGRGGDAASGSATTAPTTTAARRPEQPASTTTVPSSTSTAVPTTTEPVASSTTSTPESSTTVSVPSTEVTTVPETTTTLLGVDPVGAVDPDAGATTTTTTTPPVTTTEGAPPPPPTTTTAPESTTTTPATTTVAPTTVPTTTVPPTTQPPTTVPPPTTTVP